MKKIVLAISVLTLGLMATDFTSMTTDELIALRGTVAVEDRDAYRAEMQDRMTTFTPEQQDALRNSRSSQGRGMGQGQQSTQPILANFSSIDSDGDGQITQAELDTFRAEQQANNAEDGKLLQNIDNAPSLASIDTNGDGVIDSSEFEAHQSAQMATPSRGASGQQLQDGSAAGSMAHGAGNAESGITQQLQDGSAAGSMTQGSRGGQSMGRNR